MSVFIYIAIAILYWIIIFGGRVYFRWKKHESVTFTLQLYSPKRAIKRAKSEGEAVKE